MTRAFIALPVPYDAARSIAAIQQTIPFGRLVPADNLHLTLAFLGDQGDAALEEVHFGLEALRAAAVPVRLAGFEVFGGHESGVVALAADPAPELNALNRSVAGVVRGAGITLARRRFRPHVSVARLARLPGAEAIARLHQKPPTPVIWTARSLALVASTLSPKGARHDVLASYPLA